MNDRRRSCGAHGPDAGAFVKPGRPGEHGVRREPTIRQKPPVAGRAQEEGARCVTADAEPGVERGAAAVRQGVAAHDSQASVAAGAQLGLALVITSLSTTWQTKWVLHVV